MERITEYEIRRLVDFIEARISESNSRPEVGPHRLVSALRLIVHKQLAAIRYYRTIPPEAATVSEALAIGSWNLLVNMANVWRDHSDFPDDAAMETFDFEAEDPLKPTAGDPNGGIR